MLGGTSTSDLKQEYAQLVERNRLLEQELELTKFKLEQLLEHVYGKRSEKHIPESPAQCSLFETKATPPAEQEESYCDIKAHRRKRNSKKKFPEDLPVEEVFYRPAETCCEQCGSELQEASRDIREEYDFEPARFFKRRHVTVYCKCSKCKKTVNGIVPSQNKPVIAGSQMGPGFLAHMVTSRICDHIPYYRQSQIYEREGVIIPDKTLSRYGLEIGSLLEPIAKAIKAKLLSQDYLQADETHLDVLDSNKESNIHEGQLWLLHDPLSVVTYYEYHEGRNKVAAQALLDGFAGALQTDAYVCYNDHPGVHLGCMAHARRYFRKAYKLARTDCTYVLKQISELYRIERKLKGRRAELTLDEWFAARKLTRQKHSVKILEKLREYLLKIKDNWLLEEHPCYKAIHYMLNRFDLFCEYTRDGKFEIDNNAVENMVRPVAQGRRNWLFAGSHHGAKMAAVMMTVVQTCKKLAINPQQYLTDVLPRLADFNLSSIDGLTPFDWSPSQKADS